jgi:hypothetical protein
MHYCQQCEVAVLMQPEGDLAVCPDCRSSEPARRLPLFVVTGASGSGKTTVFPPLVAALGECAVFDVDWLIDSFQGVGAFEELDWPALMRGSASRTVLPKVVGTRCCSDRSCSTSWRTCLLADG